MKKCIADLEKEKCELLGLIQGKDKVIAELKAHNEEIENYFVESAGYGRDKVRNFMDIVNKALQQKGERIAELENELLYMKKSKAALQNVGWEEAFELFAQQEKRIAELEKENAEAKKIINAFLDFEASAMERGCYIADDTRRRAEDFIKRVD